MNDGEVGDLSHHPERSQPRSLFIRELLAGPSEGRGSSGVHGIEGVVTAGILVMVPFYDGAFHILDKLQALGGIGIVAHDITQADPLRAILLGSILKDGIQGFKVGVDVTK